MGEITIRKLDGEIITFSVFGGFSEIETTINKDILLRVLKENNIAEKEVCMLKIISDSIEVSWGGQFAPFESLTEVVLIAKTIIRLNCYNFKKSNVSRVSLQANEIWFNDGTFSDSERLEHVTCSGRILDGQHPNGLAEMLFQNCPQLKTVRGIYKGIWLMPFVFQSCTSLEEPLDIYVKELGFCAFENCQSLKRIHLHNGLKSMGHSAFKDCSSLEDIYIPDTVTSLGVKTFCGCKNLRKIHLPKCISGIPEMVFMDCSRLEKVFLPDDIAIIGTMAFKGCNLLQRPWFPDGLKEIGEEAFRGCVSMREVFLPESLTIIGDNAFADCGQLIIHCKPGSYAEEYAKKNSIPFVTDLK